MISVHDLHSLSPKKFDASHVINHLSFGTPFPGKTYPLDGKSFGISRDQGEPYIFEMEFCRVQIFWSVLCDKNFRLLI